MPSEPIRVLVTATGGTISQAVVKSVRQADLAVELHCGDADPDGIAPIFADDGCFHQLPWATDEQRYLARLAELHDQAGIDAVVPTSDPEMKLLSRCRAEGPLPYALVTQPHAWRERFDDKLRCYQALADHVALADFADGADAAAVDGLVDRAGFPLVVKDRLSSCSRGVRRVDDRAGLRDALAALDQPVVQAYIGDDAGEYSIGAFGDGERFRLIAFRRTLSSEGLSWYAETTDDPAVLDYCLGVARATGLRGSANIQVRKDADGRVRLLEINPRFSSLCAARAAAGFNDVAWSVEQALGRQPQFAHAPLRKIRFQRYIAECVDHGEGFERFGAEK